MLHFSEVAYSQRQWVHLNGLSVYTYALDLIPPERLRQISLSRSLCFDD